MTSGSESEWIMRSYHDSLKEISVISASSVSVGVENLMLDVEVRWVVNDNMYADVGGSFLTPAPLKRGA